MANLLDGVLSLDAALAFTDPDTFGESVTYSPKSGTPRTITVVVERYAPQERNGVMRPFMRVLAQNSSTAGIDATTVNYGGDTITVAYKKGGTATAYRVHAVQEETHDAGAITVELY